jgi:hypothetical protein
MDLEAERQLKLVKKSVKEKTAMAEEEGQL